MGNAAGTYYQDLVNNDPGDAPNLNGWLARAEALGALAVGNPLVVGGAGLLLAIGVGVFLLMGKRG